MSKKILSKKRNEEPLVFKPESIHRAHELYNSDIILGLPGFKLYNFERFDKFLENVKNKNVDSVRVIIYGIEGDMGVLSFFYDGSKIIVIIDWTRDHMGPPRITMYTATKIIKEESITATTYYLETPEMKYIDLFYLKNKNNFKINE